MDGCESQGMYESRYSLNHGLNFFEHTHTAKKIRLERYCFCHALSQCALCYALSNYIITYLTPVMQYK